MKIDYKIYDQAKKVRATAAAVIKNESEVVQNNERRVQEAMEIVNLCNMIISEFDNQNSSVINLGRDRDVKGHHPR